MFHILEAHRGALKFHGIIWPLPALAQEAPVVDEEASTANEEEATAPALPILLLD